MNLNNALGNWSTIGMISAVWVQTIEFYRYYLNTSPKNILLLNPIQLFAE